MPEEEKQPKSCKACIKPLTADNLFCCVVCRSSFCPGCVLDIAGNMVCAECKDWALYRIKKGLPFESKSNKEVGFPFIANRNQEESVKTELSDKSFDICAIVGFLSIPILLLVIALVMLVINYPIVGPVFIAITVFLAWLARRKLTAKSYKFPDSVELNKSGIICTLEDKSREYSWNDINYAVFHHGASGHLHLISLKTDNDSIHIDDNFERFTDIVFLVWNICRKDEIPYVEK